MSGVVLYPTYEFYPNRWFWLVAMATEMLTFRKNIQNLLLKSHKGDEAEILQKCLWHWPLHKLYFFIVVAHVFSLLWQLSFHILTMGKVEIGIYFCVTADILTKVLLECFWSSPRQTIWIWSKSLILIAGHGNQKAKFLKNIQKSSQKPYSLHSCTFRWALWPMGLCLFFFIFGFELLECLKF